MQGEFGIGDVSTWVANDADTKLVPCWHLGRRDAKSAEIFINDLAARLRGRVQLTTDGHKLYLEAIESAFGSQIDYAMLIKLYGESQDETRYSPSEVRGARKERITGNPDINHVSTSLEPDDANVNASVHATDQRLFKEDRESHVCGRAALHAL